MNHSTVQLFQRVRLLRDQVQSNAKSGWTGTIMHYTAGESHAQVEIDPHYAPKTVVGVALQDLELAP